MAEINIQRKEKSMWPWIIGGLILLLVILFLAGVFDGDKNVYDNRATTDTVTQNNPAPAATPESDFPDEVQTYLAYIREHDTTDIGLKHEYSSTALVYLADALNALVDRDYMGNAQVDSTRKILREQAANLRKDPASTEHAGMIRSAAMSAANLIEIMQKVQFPDLAATAAEVRTAAMSVNPAVLTLEQKQNIKNFFVKAGVALKAMAHRTT